jgi:hypothetical protein
MSMEGTDQKQKGSIELANANEQKATKFGTEKKTQLEVQLSP